MVKHIVFMKFEDKNQIKIVKEKLLGMREGLGDLLKDIEIGINFSNSPRAFDLALVTLFENREDLKTYSTHPVHLPVIEYIKSVNGETKVVDYEL